MKKKIPLLITHSGRFHADDIFAVATLSLVLGKVTIKRTRDASLFSSADFVVDIGGEYDPVHGRFDHHQGGGAGKHADGTPHASFGLVWNTYGETLCGSALGAHIVERKLVEPIDAFDNGVSIYKPLYGIHPYTFQDIVRAYGSTWKENNRELDTVFGMLVDMAKEILVREIKKTQDTIEGIAIVEKIYKEAKDKRILVMDVHYPYEEVLGKYKQVLFVVRPDSAMTQWGAEAIRDTMETFVSRKLFPKEWAGKMAQQLAELTGVPDALFCHNARFLVTARSKEGALKLARLALEE